MDDALALIEHVELRDAEALTVGIECNDLFPGTWVGNPGNTELRAWLDDAVAKFDQVYSGTRPGFLEGYKALKEAIHPWGA